MKKKFGLVQICRGLAALAVVGYHLNGSANDYFKCSFLGKTFLHGSLGVDFFFVLSGFIITYVHFNDLENRSNIKQFLLKRFIRIYPIYWVFCTIFILVLIFIFHGKTDHNHLEIDSINTYGYIIANYLLVTHSEDFYLVVAWTLSYEILFYFVFVTCIYAGIRKAKFIFFGWMLLVFIKMLLPDALPNTILFHERITEFLVGCFVAYAIREMKPFQNRFWIPSFSITIVLLFITYPIWLNNPWGTALLAITNGLIIYKLVQVDSEKNYRYPKLLMLIGEASYSIYLSHFLFFSVFLRIMKIVINQLNLHETVTIQCMLIIVFAFTVSAGIFIYKFLEMPMTEYLNKKFISKNLIS